MTRVVVVSHPAVLPVNQLVYAELVRRGFDLRLVVPSRWRHDYKPYVIRSEALPELGPRLTRLPVVLAGRPQRHLYRAHPRRVLRALRPDVVFLELEPFALAATQWGLASLHLGAPFGVQQAENLDRALPAPVRALRGRVLRSAAFVAARSPRAADLARQWGATGAVCVVPHHVPAWTAARRPRHAFTVGYAGRLSPEKGLDTLVGAVRRLAPPVDLLLAGDGTMRDRLERLDLGDGRRVDVRTDLGHDQMAAAYAEMDVLVLPSRTTPHWAEQFGRVLVEALWCGVPVVGSNSGEIPWVVGVTRGGTIFPEGDERALATTLAGLRAEPALRRRLALDGRRRVAEVFSVDAVARTFGALLERAAGAPDPLDDRAHRAATPQTGSGVARVRRVDARP
jgi:glycosyltransferase involved in cell wall biosynthesis